MNKLKQWFIGLSRTGKSAVIVAALIGVIAVIPTSAETETAPQSSVAPATSTTKEPEITTKTEIEKEAITYDSRREDDGSLKKGTTKIKVAGVSGEKTISHTITLTNGVETNRQTSEKVTIQPVTEVIAVGTYVKPAPTPPPASQPAASACDPNYSGCVPNVSYDLDCPDIGFMVQVLGYDKHRFDRDRNGYGCESY